MELSLVILAAGLGRRFGGRKQLQAVGPGGATLLDYAVYDARRAGFQRVVFVIHPHMERDFAKRWLPRFEGCINVDMALQDADLSPAGCGPAAGRTKPWGTAHAVLAAGRVLDTPFGVVNADDFYGAEAYLTLQNFLSQSVGGAQPPTYALVGYRLRDTLSDSGPVSRALCACSADGFLADIVEVAHIVKHGADGCHQDDNGRKHTVGGQNLVSMNMWAFTPQVLEQLDSAFQAFVSANRESPSAEFLLPGAVRDLVQAQHARVRVLETDSRWCGVTYPQDLPAVTRHIGERIAGGEYPQELWA